MDRADAPPVPRHRFAAVVLAAVLFGLLLRFVLWSAVSDLPLITIPTGDAATYVNLAETIRAEGPGVPPGEPYSQAPLYPFFLAAAGGAGLDLTGVRWIQFACGLLLVVLLAVLARRWAGDRAGMITAFLTAAYGPLLFFETELLSIVVAVTLFAAGLAAWGTRVHPLSGLALGAAGLAQPNLLLAAGAVLGTGLARPAWLGQSRRLPVVVALAGLLLPPVVTGARNLAVSGEPILVSANGGVNFFIGNNPAATGIFHLPPESGLLNRPEGLFVSAREIAERESGRTLDARAVDRAWWMRGLDYWTTQPGDALRLFGRKVLLALNRYEVPNHFDIEYFRQRVPLLRVLPALGVLLPLAAGGFVLLAGARRREALLWLGGIVFAVALFFVTARYRLPVVLVLLPAAGVFLAGAWERRRDPARLLPALGAVAVGAVLAWAPVIESSPRSLSHMHNLDGAARFSAGDLDGAAAAFRDALEADPRNAEARNNLGRTLARQGRPLDAVEQYRLALGAAPRQAETYFNLEEIYREAGRLPEAAEILDRLVQARGGQVADVAGAIAYRRGLGALARGDTATAVGGFTEAVRTDPDIGGAWAALSPLLLARGRPDLARQAADNAVSLSPRLPAARLAHGRVLDASDPEGALAAYQLAYRLSPNGPLAPEALWRIGRLFLRKRDIDQAEAHWRKAIEGTFYDPAYMDLGRLYEETGRPREATIVYRALAAESGDPRLRDHARRRLEALQKAPGARDR